MRTKLTGSVEVASPAAPLHRRGWEKSPIGWFVWAVAIFVFINIFLIVATVVIKSLGAEWFDSWLPTEWTTKYYLSVWDNYQLAHVLLVTMEVAFSDVIIALLIGTPAAYVMARKNFLGKKVLMASFLLPIMVPPITYGIPLATLLYDMHFAGTLSGVILANMVPGVPFAVLVLVPFIEQVDQNIEFAARTCGANMWQVFLRILLPLLTPGILAAGLLILVRAVALFELTYLVSGPNSQTLIVTLYYSVFASGIRPPQAVSTMAVIYMIMTLVFLVIALRFVNPTQMVSRIGDYEND